MYLCVYTVNVDVDDVVMMISAGQILHLINLIVVHVCVRSCYKHNARVCSLLFYS